MHARMIRFYLASSEGHGDAPILRQGNGEPAFDVGHLAERIIEFRSFSMKVTVCHGELVKQLLSFLRE